MNRIVRSASLVLIAVMSVSLAFSRTDKPGSKDHPGITRMPTTFLATYRYMQFDAFNFPVSDNQDKKQSVEGEKYYIRHVLKNGAERTSPLQKLFNYENATKAAGGQLVWDHMNGSHDAQATGDVAVKTGSQPH